MSKHLLRCEEQVNINVVSLFNDKRLGVTVTDEIVIFDIDGTLADVSERIHHLKKKPKNWDAFFQGMVQDKAIHSMVRLCNLLYDSGIQIILCSGRHERSEERRVGKEC